MALSLAELVGLLCNHNKVGKVKLSEILNIWENAVILELNTVYGLKIYMRL